MGSVINTTARGAYSDGGEPFATHAAHLAGTRVIENLARAPGPPVSAVEIREMTAVLSLREGPVVMKPEPRDFCEIGKKKNP